VTTTNEATRPIVKKRMVARETTRAAAVMTMINTRMPGTKQIKRTSKLNFGRTIQMTTMRRMNKIELREITKKVTIHKKTAKASENVSCEDASNKQKSGGKSKIRDDNVMTEVVPTDNRKKGGGKETTTTEMKQIKRTLKLKFWRPIQMTRMRRMNKKEVTSHKKTVK
jgi:hypothetical protein